MVDSNICVDMNVSALVSFLDQVHYNDTNYPGRDARLEALNETWKAVAQHFERHIRDGNLRIETKKMEAGMRTAILFVLYTMPKLPQQTKVDVSIFFSYAALVDDNIACASSNTPEANIDTWLDDLVAGKEQRHPFWRLLNTHLAKLFEHYSSFCRLAIYRGTLDWYHGSWIESRDFLYVSANEP